MPWGLAPIFNGGFPKNALGPGTHYKEEEPCLETVAIASQMKERGTLMVAHHIPHEARGPWREPGWPTLNYKEEEPCLETVAFTSQMKRRVAVMVAHHTPHETKGPGENLGDLHLITRRKSHAWKQWPSPVR